MLEDQGEVELTCAADIKPKQPKTIYFINNIERINFKKNRKMSVEGILSSIFNTNIENYWLCRLNGCKSNDIYTDLNRIIKVKNGDRFSGFAKCR